MVIRARWSLVGSRYVPGGCREGCLVQRFEGKGDMRTSAVFLVLLCGATTAKAQWIVSDPAGLIQQFQTAIQTYESVKRLQQQISTAKQQLEKLDVSTLTDFSNFAQNQRNLYGMIERDLNGVSLQAKRVDQQYGAIFGDDPKKMTPEQRQEAARKWTDAMRDTRQAAIRAQSNAEQADQNAQAMQKVVQASGESSSTVAQMQLIVQGLAQLSNQITTLSRSVDTGFRLQAMQASTTDAAGELRRAETAREFKSLDEPLPPRVTDDSLPTPEKSAAWNK